MANDLSVIMPKILAGGLMALRQQASIVSLVNTDYGTDAKQKGNTIDVEIPSAVAVADVTPANTPPATNDQVPTKASIALSNWKEAAFYLSDKDIIEVDTEGIYIPSQASEAAKALANAVAADVYSHYKDIYGKVGTAGTTPFASDVSAATLARKQLNLQLAPMDPRRAIIDPSAEANALALAAFNANAGTQEEGPMINGNIGRKLGFDWFMDQSVPVHTSTPLTAGAATVNGVNAVGSATLSIAKATNTSPLVKGDILSIAGFTQTYVVTADTTLAVGNTSVPISPTLQVATAGGEAVTLTASHTANLAFHRDCFALATRPLSSVGGAGLGSQFMSMVDPVTKLTLRLEVRREHKRLRWSFDILWGSACVRPALGCRILG